MSEPTIRSGHTVIRPDLVIQKDDSVKVLDLCVPWERSVDALARAEDAKVERYRPCDADIRRYIRQSDLFAGHDGDIEYRGVAVGARGGIQCSDQAVAGHLGDRTRSRRSDAGTRHPRLRVHAELPGQGVSK